MPADWAAWLNGAGRANEYDMDIVSVDPPKALAGMFNCKPSMGVPGAETFIVVGLVSLTVAVPLPEAPITTATDCALPLFVGSANTTAQFFALVIVTVAICGPKVVVQSPCHLTRIEPSSGSATSCTVA